MKFVFIQLLNLIFGVLSHREELVKSDQKFNLQDGSQQNPPPERRFWTEDIYHKVKQQRPYIRPQVYENRGPAIFPQQEQAFPPGGPSVLAPATGSQTFKVGSSLNVGGNRQNSYGFGSFNGGGIQTSSSGSFGSRPFGNGNFQGTNSFQGGAGGFPQGTTSGFQGTAGVGESFEVPIGSIGGLENTAGFNGQNFPGFNGQNFQGFNGQNFQGLNGQNPIGGGIGSDTFNAFGSEGLGGLPGKFESTLAKNPLFLVLKLLITDPGLWVTSPVLYHGLAHTGIVKPFPLGFGIYGYRFQNNVPDSQVFGSENILQDRP